MPSYGDDHFDTNFIIIYKFRFLLGTPVPYLVSRAPPGWVLPGCIVCKRLLAWQGQSLYGVLFDKLCSIVSTQKNNRAARCGKFLRNVWPGRYFFECVARSVIF